MWEILLRRAAFPHTLVLRRIHIGCHPLFPKGVCIRDLRSARKHSYRFVNLGEVSDATCSRHDAILQMGWNLGTPKEDHAFAAIWEHVSMLVGFQKRRPGEVSELKQGLIAFSC